MIFGVGLAEKFKLVVWRAIGGNKYRIESRDQQQKTSAKAGEADTEAAGDYAVTRGLAWVMQRGPGLT